MKYSVEKISTVEACDILLANAHRKKEALERRRRRLGDSLDAFRGRIDRMDKESAEVSISIEVFTTAYGALPEGKQKMRMLLEIKRLELRQTKLELKALTCNVALLLVKEMRYNCLDSQVSALGEYIVAVENMRIALLVDLTWLGDRDAIFSDLSVAEQKTLSEKSTLAYPSKLNLIGSFQDLSARIIPLTSSPQRICFQHTQLLGLRDYSLANGITRLYQGETRTARKGS